MTEPLDNYAPRTWKTYVLTPEEGGKLPLRAETELLDLISTSPHAEALCRLPDWDPTKVVFTDFEQVSSGHQCYGTGPLVRLTTEYLGHPAGTLGFVSYEGMEKDERTYLLWLESAT